MQNFLIIVNKALKIDIKTRLDNLQNAEKKLSDQEEERIRELLGYIDSVQLKISAIMLEFGFPERCSACKNPCCTAGMSKRAISVTDIYVATFDTEGDQREKILSAIHNFNNTDKNCCFLDPEIGCVISETRRPLVCKIYFCDPMLAGKTHLLARELRDLYREIATILAGELRRKN